MSRLIPATVCLALGLLIGRIIWQAVISPQPGAPPLLISLILVLFLGTALSAWLQRLL